MDSYKNAYKKVFKLYLTWEFPWHYFALTGHTKLGTQNFHFQADRAENACAYE